MTDVFNSTLLDTGLGSMMAIADEHALYLLDFVDSDRFDRKYALFNEHVRAAIVPCRNAIIDMIEVEVDLHSKGVLKEFKTPVALWGSPFQELVWNALQRIPYGTTWSYAQLAQCIGKPSACRAVARAAGANPLAIIVPCHRVIHANGMVGGYSGGVYRKVLLIGSEMGSV